MVSLRIREILSERRATQVWLAGELGVTKMTVNSWCTGRRYPSIEQLDRIATLMGVKITELFEAAPARRAMTLQVKIGSRTISLTPDVILAAAKTTQENYTTI